MNLNFVKINVIVLLLVVESRGGVLERAYGSFMNTTTGLKQDVKNVWSYSKSFVGLGDPAAEQKEEERGLIGGMIHSAHEKVHTFHEQIWAVDEIPNDSGLLWNLYCRLKQRLENAKNYILRNKDKTEGTTQPPNPEVVVIKDTMEKLFNADGTRKMDETAFNEAVENLRKKLNDMRKNTEDNTPVHHGEGLIDIRMVETADVQDNAADDTGVANDIYDKVQDNVNAGNDKINKNIDNGIEVAENGYNKVKEEAIALKDKASDGRMGW